MTPEEIAELESKLEPVGWEPPETLSGPEVLALAARPGEPASDVLDDYYAEVADGILTGKIKGSAAKVVARAFADEDPPYTRELSYEAQIWAEGYEAGADHVSSCCGCTGMGEPPANPYDHTEAS